MAKRDERSYGRVIGDIFYCGYCGEPHILKDYKHGIPTRCKKCGKYTVVMLETMLNHKNGQPNLPKGFIEYLFSRQEKK
jgi:hypothetical protein